MNISLHLEDKVEVVDVAKIAGATQLIQDRTSAHPKKTRIILRNHDTGEILDQRENKLLISGSQFNVMSVFGITEPDVKFPTYNEEIGLDNTVAKGTKPKNAPIVCLFGISDSGCGEQPKDVYTTSYTDRIKPAPSNPASISEFKSEMLMPFRYVDETADLNSDLRKYYFGRKRFPKLGKVGYYFKTFDTEPQIHLKYADGTQITEDIYKSLSAQSAECYVEMRLRVTRLDFRDYFENVLGWDKARISAMTLCFAWYDDTIDNYRYYQDITPYTLLNFQYQWLVDLDVAIDIEYQIYY